MVGSSKGKREVLVERYRKLGTPTTNKTFDVEFAKEIKEINAWVEANVDASEREDSGSEGLHREFTREELKKWEAKLKNRRQQGQTEYHSQLICEVRGRRVMSNNWIWKIEYVLRRWREGVVVNLFKKGDKADPENYREVTLLSTVGKTFHQVQDFER